MPRFSVTTFPTDYGLAVVDLARAVEERGLDWFKLEQLFASKIFKQDVEIIIIVFLVGGASAFIFPQVPRPVAHQPSTAIVGPHL
jgi:hypothetical protein